MDKYYTQLHAASLVGSGIALCLLVRARRSSASEHRRRRTSLLAFGVDFGGTAMKVALMDGRDGTVLQRLTVPIAATREPADVVDQIEEACEQLREKQQVRWEDVGALGICCPGRVEGGVVSTIANLSRWHDIPLADLLQERTRIPSVTACNDAKAALIGEMWSGAAAGKKNVVMVTLGTGVGGAVAVDGKVLLGHTGMLGEIGHHIICVDGVHSKATGVKGIAEEYCSARAVQRIWREMSGQTDAPEVHAIFAAAEANVDELAVRVTQNVFRYVGVLLANCCRVYDPECIILGGGMASSEWFVSQCRSAMLEHHWNIAPCTTEISRAVLGNWAGTAGAASVALM